MAISILTDYITEKSTPTIRFQIVDEAEVGFAPETLTLTFYDKDTDDVINGRNTQDVLNANNVTVDASGNVVWNMTPLDNPIVTASTLQEEHIALWHYTWNSGAKVAYHEIRMTVQNTHMVS